jgi:hypothetical protein
MPFTFPPETGTVEVVDEVVGVVELVWVVRTEVGRIVVEFVERWIDAVAVEDSSSVQRLENCGTWLVAAARWREGQQ